MDLGIKKKYMIFSIVTNTTKDNRPFIRMTLTDTDGASMNAIMFDSNKLSFTPERSQVVEVTGALQQYNGVTQLKVSDMVLLEGEDANEFLPKSDKDAKAMEEELKAVLQKHIKSSYFKSLCNAFYADKEVYNIFVKSPAAKSVHHAYINGLLEHTLSMVKLSALICDFYGKDVCNKELTIMGALFHDIGKTKEIDLENSFEYTDEGKLLGHLIMGMNMVDKYIASIPDFPKKARDLLLHLIASHHGLLEFGSPKRPKTKEAFILHYVDNIDAKINAFNNAFEKENVVEGGWSQYDRILERQFYNHGLIPEE